MFVCKFTVGGELEQRPYTEKLSTVRVCLVVVVFVIGGGGSLHFNSFHITDKAATPYQYYS